MSKKIRRLRPRHPLRGKRLQDAAIKELEDTASWQCGVPLSWQALAARLNVSRQAIATKPEVVAAYHVTKEKLAEVPVTSPEAIVKRTLGQRIEELEAQLKEKDRQLDAWIEKWVTVETNASTYGYKPDLLFAPLTKPNRIATR